MIEAKQFIISQEEKQKMHEYISLLTSYHKKRRRKCMNISASSQTKALLFGRRCVLFSFSLAFFLPF
jgi:hypothetical protein